MAKNNNNNNNKQGAQYFHWVVTNIPGLDLGAGAEVMQYIPPFQVIFSIKITEQLKLH